MKNTGKILMGLTGLFATGVLIGALYAPDKGERTRRRIARKGRWFLHSANDTVEEGKDMLEEIKDRMKDNLEKINDEMERLAYCRRTQ